MKKIWAVRGATTVSKDTSEEIVRATVELLQKIFEKNKMQFEDMVSVIFTTTPDLKSEFPAVAARKLGLTDTPLMCAQEISKAGALPLCIRVLIYFYTDLAKTELIPVYLGEAIKLRPDLA